MPPSPRTAEFAGRFYPESPEELSREIDSYLDKAKVPRIEGDIVAALAPHAGYSYSGPVAAHTYKALQGKKFDVVAIIGSPHRAPYPGLLLDERSAYRTPLGEVPVDLDALDKLRRSPARVRVSPEAHAGEHSVEVQVPFLQKTLEGFSILPMVAGAHSAEEAKPLGEALVKALEGKRALILASADLSHFPSQEDARRADLACLQAAAVMDPEYLFTTEAALMDLRIKRMDCACCGTGALAVAQAAAARLGADRGQVLRYANSGDVSGDPDRVVGYGSALFLKTGKPREERLFELSESDKKELLALARKSLDEHLRKGTEPKPVLSENPRLNLPSGVFVTWWRRGASGLDLRGCIGDPYAEKTLGNAVGYYAIQSATSDPRFPRIRGPELPLLACEVSVLSPMMPSSLDRVRPGIGVMLASGDRRGLFLPEVWEKLPGKDEFLGELCRQKLGLSYDAWRTSSLEVFTFSSQVALEE
ncbi:MAG: AmmeMemoRadiSam system protein B [Elusimicrobiota bacterium]